jgi:glycosyltransferase involved in cell wall biosynthesis
VTPDGPLVWQSRWGLPLGYSIHSEEMALARLERGVDLYFRASPWPVRGAIRHPELQRVSERQAPAGPPCVIYDQADLFDLERRGFKVGFTMLEVDGLPPDWVAACNRMDEVWTPSRWGVEVFRQAGVTRPLRSMPLGFDPARFRPGLPAHRIAGRCTFLSVFEWGERKAPELLLRAFAAAFTARDDVALVLRVNNFDGDVDVPGEIARLGLPADAPPVLLLLNHQVRADELGSLYCSADCFVLPTRGEGWGMPALEAMACGLPVIATAWSGLTEFLDEEVALPVRPRALIDARAKCPYYEGFRWADPDFDELVGRLRWVYRNREAARELGRRAATRAGERWTWAQTAERILAALPNPVA